MRRLVLLAVPFALAAAGCGSGGGDTTTTTAAKPSPPACSAAKLSPKLPAEQLPDAVAATRSRIAEAAVACNYAELQRIARESPKGFTYSFGASGSPAAYWRKLERSGDDRPLARLVKILRLPVTRNEAGAYAWPSAYTEHPTDADWDALVREGIYSRAQVEQMRTGAGMYLGYRTAITRDGGWQFFVAGD